MFLYAERAAEAALTGALDPLDESSYPASLDEAFYGWFERAFPDLGEYEGRWRLPVGAVAASPQPLPAAELEALLGLSEAGSRDLLRRLGSLVARGEGEFGEETASLSSVIWSSSRERNWS